MRLEGMGLHGLFIVSSPASRLWLAMLISSRFTQIHIILKMMWCEASVGAAIVPYIVCGRISHVLWIELQGVVRWTYHGYGQGDEVVLREEIERIGKICALLREKAHSPRQAGKR